MYICLCTALTEKDIEAFILTKQKRNEIIKLENLQQETNAGTMCKSCIDTLKEIVEKRCCVKN